MPPVELWAWAFGWTVAIEAPIVVGALRLATSWRQPWGRAIALAISLQLLTHPALWYLAPRFDPYLLWLILMEAGVALAEMAALTLALSSLPSEAEPRPTFRATLIFAGSLSLIANLTSATIGLLLL